jgi:hypothetical protein
MAPPANKSGIDRHLVGVVISPHFSRFIKSIKHILVTKIIINKSR